MGIIHTMSEKRDAQMPPGMKNEIRAVLAYAIKDPEFRASLFADPVSACKDAGCDDATAQGFRDFTPDHFYQYVGQLTAHLLLPARIGKQFTIVPDWLEVPFVEDRKIIRLNQNLTGASISSEGISINAGLAFGNGWHPTTSLCIQALEQVLQPGDTFLDLGTGSGVLAIAASKLGAGKVYALDIDFDAVQIARQNAGINRLNSRAKFICGPWQAAAGFRSTPFDLIAANLITPIIIEVLTHGLTGILKKGGTLILSGVRSNKLPIVIETASQSGCRVVRKGTYGRWAALILCRET